MIQAMKQRISRRNFTKDKLRANEIETIEHWTNQINAISALSLQFLEDGSKAFSHLKKSYGIFSNVHAMILMKGNVADLNLKEKIGYYGETLLLKIVTLGLGTCWVGGTYDKNELDIPEKETLIGVILVGNIDKSMKDIFLRQVIGRNRKSIEKRIVTDAPLPEWILQGLEAVKIAPSAKNSQKPLFRYEKGVLRAEVLEEEPFDLVDLGIAKKHFELGAAHGTFELGNGGAFKLSKE